ncbi:MAG: flagellar hook-length control protein FliK, partial [Methylobacter sp.]
DFKANLLKFIQALKQEIIPQGGQPLNQVDLDLLKNLQHKTENTVAKLTLDQLMSLPKEDNPKQLWIIDIPFVDRQQAESVRIEVQRDKENRQQSGNGDWSVNITITPPGLDTIHCIASYRDNVINTFFKSRNTQTAELIKHHLDYLKTQLEESGLKTGHMDAHDEAQKTQPAHPHQLSQKKLFDDNA